MGRGKKVSKITRAGRILQTGQGGKTGTKKLNGKTKEYKGGNLDKRRRKKIRFASPKRRDASGRSLQSVPSLYIIFGKQQVSIWTLANRELLNEHRKAKHDLLWSHNRAA